MNFLGIDIGTTSVKTAVFDELLNQKISLTADYTLDAHGDTVEFDGEKYWEIVKGEIEKLKKELSIDALAVDTQCETLILTDEHGTPVRPAIVWLDNRATEGQRSLQSTLATSAYTRSRVSPRSRRPGPPASCSGSSGTSPRSSQKRKRSFCLRIGSSTK